MTINDKLNHTGTFSLSLNRQLSGELSFESSKPVLTLYDSKPIFLGADKQPTITGILSDLSKVTLIGCYSRSSGKVSRNGEAKYYIEISPHYIAHGSVHFACEQLLTAAISLEIDDPSPLFVAPGTTGSTTVSKEDIQRLFSNRNGTQPIQFGQHPSVFYFSGLRTLLTTDTVFGELAIHNVPNERHSSGSKIELSVNSRIVLKFAEHEPFDNASEKAIPILRFIDIVSGRCQNVLRFAVQVPAESEWEEWLEILPVNWSNFGPPKEPSEHTSMDMLIRAWEQPEKFGGLFANWLSKDETWKDARRRFSTAFQKSYFYDIDRLVGAANMFDILPETAVPKSVAISAELAATKEQCRQIFKALPNSVERNSILNALGRIGESSLKHKVRHRAEIITSALGEKLPDLTVASDQAINLRNHYVHGSPLKFNYADNTNVGIFLTDTLEFIFAISDLMESGWDASSWITQSSTANHPFFRYLRNYTTQLQTLKDLLAS